MQVAQRRVLGKRREEYHMLKRQVAYIVILGLLFTGIANAGSDTFSGFGMSRLSCGKYIQDITTDPQFANVYSWWVAGFVTGADLGKGRVTSTDNEAHDAWLKKYCQENPLDTFMKAAIELNKALGR
jgi:hypothetical protein